MLGEILEEKYGLRITLSGQHTNFFPWVPLVGYSPMPSGKWSSISRSFLKWHMATYL
jgi:hypothetical protein